MEVYNLINTCFFSYFLNYYSIACPSFILYVPTVRLLEGDTGSTKNYFFFEAEDGSAKFDFLLDAEGGSFNFLMLSDNVYFQFLLPADTISSHWF